jgi:hypothetical protein
MGNLQADTCAHGLGRRTLITAPVIVDDDGDLDFFASIEDAELFLEPWAVEEGFTAYDSEGRLLELRVERRESPFLFGLWKTAVDHVAIEAVEDQPNHAPQLRATLLTFFRRTGVSLETPDELPLRELVRSGVEHVGFTR